MANRALFMRVVNLSYFPTLCCIRFRFRFLFEDPGVNLPLWGNPSLSRPTSQEIVFLSWSEGEWRTGLLAENNQIGKIAFV
jgi:hypothetical protein